MDQKELDFVQVLKTFSGGESDQEFLYRLSPLCKLLLWFITLSSLAIGWIMKSVIFKYIAKTGFKDQPINLMILTEQIVHFVSGSFVLISYLMSQSMGLSVGDMIRDYSLSLITDRQYCWIFCNLQLLSNVYRGINGVGMAVVRFLYTIEGTWVRYRFGQRRFFFFSWASVMILSASITVFYCMESITNRPLYFICIGRDRNLENVIQDYITSGINNDQNIAASRGWIPVAVLAFGMFLYATELCCYLKMFRYLYLYNNSLSILPQQVTRNRNRTNAQTMIGQFYFFVADTLYALFLFVAFLPSVSLVSADLKDLGIFMKTLDFGLMSSIHCLLIPALRKKIYLYLVITWNGLKGVVKHHQH